MKEHGRFYRVNIVLGIVFVILTVVNAGVGIVRYSIGNQVSQWNVSGTSSGSGEKTSEGTGTEAGNGTKDGEETEEVSEEAGDSQGDYQWYTRMKVEKAEAELLGDSFEDENAERGYQFYKVSLEVKNEGTMSGSSSLIYTEFKGNEPEDVADYIEQDMWESPEFSSGMYERIPSARNGTVERVIQVKKGIKEVSMTCSGDVEEETFMVKLPQQE